jgi:thiol-disulfide isomerase/thioredoxin
MVTITRFMVPGREFWATQCQECLGVVQFHLALAAFCPHCQEIMPPYARLVDEDPDFAEDYKMRYHKTGEVY